MRSHEVLARNYAWDSANRMHSDAVAREYGFAGGLVPGVAVYAYMMQPVVEAFGREWIERGWIKGKFLKPLYDGERATVLGRLAQPRGTGSATSSLMELEVLNGEGTLCAVGSAGMEPALGRPFGFGGVAWDEAAAGTPRAEDYPEAPLPDEAARPQASLATLAVGRVLGSIVAPFEAAAAAAKAKEDFLAAAEPWSGASGGAHPAIYAAWANDLLARNVVLGPWIHTETQARHFGQPRDGERLALRGRVAAAGEKRGHEVVALDVALFGAGERPIARLLHGAIIRPRRAGPAAPA